MKVIKGQVSQHTPWHIIIFQPVARRLSERRCDKWRRKSGAHVCRPCVFTKALNGRLEQLYSSSWPGKDAVNEILSGLTGSSFKIHQREFFLIN